MTVRSFAVLPAAGRSRRMGRPKLLLPWGETTVIQHVLAAWRASRVDRVVVVLHHDDVELAAACRAAGAETVVPDIPPPDMKTSVCHGLDHISRIWFPTSAESWLLAPADMPLLSAATIDDVLAAHDPAWPRIVVPGHGGRRGHPVLFPWPLAAEVARLPEGGGINLLLRQFAVLEIDSPDPGMFSDLDTPDDYQRLHGCTS